MVTLYRLQRRNLMYASTPTVPNNFQLIAELAPAAGFVGTKEPSLTSHAGAEGEILINIYSGRSGVVSNPPLPPVAVTLLLAPHHITLMGNKVVVSGKLTSLSEIPDVVGTIEHAILPYA